MQIGFDVWRIFQKAELSCCYHASFGISRIDKGYYGIVVGKYEITTKQGSGYCSLRRFDFDLLACRNPGDHRIIEVAFDGIYDEAAETKIIDVGWLNCKIVRFPNI